MRSVIAAGLAGLAATAYAATTCTQETITITSAAQATNIACDVVTGTILIEDPTITDVTLDGPKQVGSLVVAGATRLVNLASSTINSIDGIFNLTELNSLSMLKFPALRSVGDIHWISLDQLPGVTFGTEGVTKVSKIVISDTFINTLDGLNVASVDDININNNRKLVVWDSDLANVTSTFKIQNNGAGAMVINLPVLRWANNIEVRNVKELHIPNLVAVNQSMRFDENEMMTDFSAPNVSLVREVSFTNNNKLTNITYPKLVQTEGAVTIQNNTALETINGFPRLQTVKGTFILRGSFTEASFPSLKNVFGQGTITSTEDIDNSCEFFNDLHNSGDIMGEGYTCTSENERANEGGDGGRTAGDSGAGEDDNAAGLVASNLAAAFGIAIVGGMILL